MARARKRKIFTKGKKIFFKNFIFTLFYSSKKCKTIKTTSWLSGVHAGQKSMMPRMVVGSSPTGDGAFLQIIFGV